jgi:hypothetical protein
LTMARGGIRAWTLLWRSSRKFLQLQTLHYIEGGGGLKNAYAYSKSVL